MEIYFPVFSSVEFISFLVSRNDLVWSSYSMLFLQPFRYKQNQIYFTVSFVVFSPRRFSRNDIYQNLSENFSEAEKQTRIYELKKTCEARREEIKCTLESAGEKQESIESVVT